MASSQIRSEKGDSILAPTNDYVVLDVETTGFSPAVNEIIEIGAVRVRNGVARETFNSLVKTKDLISGNIVKLTGITNEMVQNDGKPIETVLMEVLEFIGSDIIVGHNVNFDINFLYDNAVLYCNQPVKNDFIDTMRLSRSFVKDVYRHTLTTLAEKFELEYATKHRAVEDAKITYQIYEKLKHIAKHFVEIELDRLEPHLKTSHDFMNKHVTVKTKLHHIDESVLKAVLSQYDTKVYSALLNNTDTLMVNDTTFQKLQEPLDDDDMYLHMFNEWMFRAQERVTNGNLKIVSESDLCNAIGIPLSINVERGVDQSSPLYEKYCVFTGMFERMTRKQAETIVSSIGGIVGNGVTKKTNYLILGNNDYNASVKNGKSTKHKKAEELQLRGQEIEIIPEDIFYEMIG